MQEKCSRGVLLVVNHNPVRIGPGIDFVCRAHDIRGKSVSFADTLCLIFTSRMELQRLLLSTSAQELIPNELRCRNVAPDYV